MLCALRLGLVYSALKKNSAHRACLEGALERKAQKSPPLFLNGTSRRKLPRGLKTQGALARAQTKLRAHGRFTPSRNPAGGHIDTGAAAIGTPEGRERFRSVLLFLDATVVLNPQLLAPTTHPLGDMMVEAIETHFLL